MHVSHWPFVSRMSQPPTHMSQGALKPRVGTRDRTAATNRSMDGTSVGPKAMTSVLFYSPLRTASNEHLLTTNTSASGFPSCPKRPRTSASSKSSSGSSFLSLSAPAALPPSSQSVPFSVPLSIDPLLSADIHANYNYWGGVVVPRNNNNYNTGCMRSASSTLAAHATVLCSSGRTSTSTNTSTVTTSTMGMQGHCAGTGADSGSMQGGGVAMFVDSFLPEDDPTLYSLWTGPGNSDSVLGYETESTPHQGQGQEQGQEQGQNHAPEAPSSLYLTSDDELKIDYPQLSEFHQDLDSYLNETMESGGPSPTTPLGTHSNCSMKMDRLVTIDRKSGTGHGAQLPMGTRELLLEKSLVSATTAEHLVKRERATTGLENVSERLNVKSRGGRVDAPYAAVPVGTSSTVEAASRETVASSHWTLPQNSMIEPKQRVESHHGGRTPLITAPAATSQTAGASDETATSTITVKSTSATSGTANAKAKKRPRSRQCEFPGCQNRARSHQKCKKHGGAHHCVFGGCTKNSQSRGLCIAHGGGSRCKKEGCIRAAQSKGLCKSHGGGEYCAVEGCKKKAHLKHLCRTHGGGVRCRFDKCSKWAQRKGWCMAHAKEFASS